MKIELNHITPYLPYGLKIQSTLGIKELHYDRFLDNKLMVIDVLKATFNEKPILHPLPDLTKEIEVDGEKFISIEKLLDIESQCNWSSSDYLSIGVGRYEWWVRLKDSQTVFGYNSITGFYSMVDSNFKLVHNQLKLFNKLFEWHFDVFRLIENGLAIDINTL